MFVIFDFISVFSGSHINDRSDRSKLYCFIHFVFRVGTLLTTFYGKFAYSHVNSYLDCRKEKV